MGREVAKRMLPRARGTILFTGATASLRGADGYAAFAGGKDALRTLAQSMARELGPKGIHVGHVVIDGPIDTDATRAMFADWFAARPPDGIMQPDDLAEIFGSCIDNPDRHGLLKPTFEPLSNHGSGKFGDADGKPCLFDHRCWP